MNKKNLSFPGVLWGLMWLGCGMSPVGSYLWTLDLSTGHRWGSCGNSKRWFFGGSTSPGWILRIYSLISLPVCHFSHGGNERRCFTVSFSMLPSCDRLYSLNCELKPIFHPSVDSWGIWSQQWEKLLVQGDRQLLRLYIKSTTRELKHCRIK